MGIEYYYTFSMIFKYRNSSTKGNIVMTLVILAAGMGSRYGGMKQIDPITDNGEFIIDFSIFDAIKAGFNKVVFIIKDEIYKDFKDTIGKRVEPFINVEYAFQRIDNIPKGVKAPLDRTKPWGTAHAVLCAKDYIKDDFMVINADDFYGREAFNIIFNHFKNNNNNGSIIHNCMVGYELKKTLTENGTVSRGECFINSENMLCDIIERSKIKPNGGYAEYMEGTNWYKMPYDTTVSMNCWGLSPAILDGMSNDFETFFHLNRNNLDKAEYYLPYAVKEQIIKNLCDIKVYKTNSEWYGVTYHDDKLRVVEAIRTLIKNKIYPDNLWS